MRGYFKQQGLSKEQMEQAIAAFKQQQEANQPDVAALQSQVTQAQSATQQAQLNDTSKMVHCSAQGMLIEAKMDENVWRKHLSDIETEK